MTKDEEIEYYKGVADNLGLCIDREVAARQLAQRYNAAYKDMLVSDIMKNNKVSRFNAEKLLECWIEEFYPEVKNPPDPC